MTISPVASQYSGQNVAARDIEQEALELRKRGLSYQKIAVALGLNDRSAAYKVIKRAVSRIDQETAEEAKKLMFEQLNDMYARTTELYESEVAKTFFGQVLTDDDGKPILIEQNVTAKLKAQDQMIKIQESMRKLLGLDAPVKAELSGQVSIEARTLAVVQHLQELKAADG